jgi:alpha-tubulin suppressor-like RCC1 family protein
MQCYAFLSLILGISLSLAAQTQQRTDCAFGSTGSVGEDSPGQLDVKGIAAGGSHSVVLASDGSVWVWGSNSEGQVGNRAFASTPAPSQVYGLSGVIAISAGFAHTLALRSDGTVWAWGRNSEGQLGDGTNTNRAIPVQVLGLSGIMAVAAGSAHSLAVDREGTVFAWGSNHSGELGDETTANRSTPGRVHGLPSITAIAAGQAHSLALGPEGGVWAWGNNWYGQLGSGAIAPQEWTPSTPAKISGLTDITSVAAGYGHSIALKADGTVWVWGNDGAFAILSPTPVQATGLTNVQAIAAGLGTSLAVKGDGTVWEWGYDIVSRSINAAPRVQTTPTPVIELAGITAVSLPAGNSYGLALKHDGTAWVWGGFLETQLGQVATARPLPRQLDGIFDVATVSAGMVLKSNGTVWAWQPPFTWGWLDREMPLEVADLIGVVKITSGTTGYNLVLRDDGAVWRVVGSWPLFSVPNLREVVAIAAGESHALAVKHDGTVWELSGVNSPAIRTAGLTDVAAVAVAFEWWWALDGNPILIRSLALKRDGSVWTWDGVWSTRSAPAQITGLDGVIAIAGGEISLALKQDGTVWQWDATSDKPAPVQVSGLAGVAAIAIGGADHWSRSSRAHALALKTDGTVWAWGPNTFGQLGDGTTLDRVSPVQVMDLSDVVAIGATGSSSAAVRRDGTVWAWGAGPARSRGTWSLPAQLPLPGSGR